MPQNQNRRNDRVRQDLYVIPLTVAAPAPGRGECFPGFDVMLHLLSLTFLIR